MEETINQRIILFLRESSVTVTAVARQLGISQTTLSMQLKGERALSAGIIEKILIAFPNVSAEWIMRGTGTMYIGECETSAGVDYKSGTNCCDKDDSIWKAKYEAIKECYDILVTSLGGSVIGKRNVG